MKAQLKTGDLVEVEITAQNQNGEGIAKMEDVVVFVKGAGKGQKCKVKIIEVKRTYATAETL